MKADSLWKISVSIAAEAEGAVVELLATVFGLTPLVYCDAETGETFVIVYPPKRGDWSPARRAEIVAGLKRIASCDLDLGPGKITARTIRREDWAESWKRHFQPMEIGRLLVKPSWSQRKPKKHQAVVVLDPGLSFGTGQHPTTRFCLEQLVAHHKPDGAQSFLDIGTGSGILAIAAAKLGYAPVEAFDFDPDAVRIALTNARANHLSLPLAHRDLTRLPLRSKRRYDFICANLIYDLLLAEKGRILQRLSASGTLVLAGVLCSQFAAVRRHYEHSGLIMSAHRVEKEWESGAFAAPP